MLRKKVATVICLVFAVNFLMAQNIDITLYQRTTLWETTNIPWYIPRDFVEYSKADVRFVSSFLWWGDVTRWEVEDPDLRVTGVRMTPAPDLLPPERMQIVTIFFRWIPEIGRVIDYWIEAENQPVEIAIVPQEIDMTLYQNAQEVTVTDFSIIAENLDIGGMPSLRERYDRIVDKDIQELMNRENIQYIDTFFSSREAHPWIGLEKSFLIEDLFLENILNAWEEFIIYRLRFKQDDMVFVVYTMLAAPFSFMSHFRIFVREINYSMDTSSPVYMPGFQEAVAVELDVAAEYESVDIAAVIVSEAGNVTESGIPLWVWLAVAGGVAAVGGVVFVVKRKKA